MIGASLSRSDVSFTKAVKRYRIVFRESLRRVLRRERRQPRHFRDDRAVDVALPGQVRLQEVGAQVVGEQGALPFGLQIDEIVPLVVEPQHDSRRDPWEVLLEGRQHHQRTVAGHSEIQRRGIVLPDEIRRSCVPPGTQYPCVNESPSAATSTRPERQTSSGLLKPRLSLR